MKPIIEIKNLSKQYSIQHLQLSTQRSFKEDLENLIKAPVRKFRGSSFTKEKFYALDNASFSVNRGDIIGIIGKNGAGKSTLLKILSRITFPTSGQAILRGRVASLLEVGTGFHPDLTGRENIFLNGALLGMKNQEIKDRFNEIMAFAEVEKFIDTPVKYYSSGMYMRLAFAVAAHLEPEILIIDEVLSVGDAEFQKKSLGKMSEVSKSGRTILFVSHNMNAIEQLCNKAILLESGKIKMVSHDVRSVINLYLYEGRSDKDLSEWARRDKTYDNEWFTPTRFLLANNEGQRIKMTATNNDNIWVQIEGEIRNYDPAITIGYAIYDDSGQVIYWSYPTDVPEKDWPRLREGKIVLRSQIPRKLLNQGKYRLELIGGLHFRQWFFEPRVKAPSIFLNIHGKLSESPYWMIKRPGLLAPVIKWEVR